MIEDRNNVTDSLIRDASRWVTQLVSGEATTTDAERLAQWRRQSPAHDAAFAEAVRVWWSSNPEGMRSLRAGAFRPGPDGGNR